MGRVEKQPELGHGDDSFGGEVFWLTLLRRDTQAGGAQCVLEIKIGPEAIGPQQDMAHGPLNLWRDRRHAARELPLECSDVVVDAECLEVFLQFAGERFARALLLPEKKRPHRAKQRSWHPFERAMGTGCHARYSLNPSAEP